MLCVWGDNRGMDGDIMLHVNIIVKKRLMQGRIYDFRKGGGGPRKYYNAVHSRTYARRFFPSL